jgi:antitoxin component HigA of HigAB toxin-antitoxin module
MSTARKLIDSLKANVRPSSPKADTTYLQIVELFPLQPIVSKGQHAVALKVVENLISYLNEAKDGGAEMYLATLAELIKDYEQNQYKSGPISGAEMLNYLMELQGLHQSDLAKELGGSGGKSYFLSQ